MRQLEKALTLLADRAEPLPTEVLIARIETGLGMAPRAVADFKEPAMVTHETIQRKPSMQESRPPWWRRPIAALSAAVVVILVGVGVLFALDIFGTDDGPTGDIDEIATVYEVIDTFNAYDFDAYAGYFPEGATDMFAEDGPIGSQEWRDGVAVDKTIGTQWRLSDCTLAASPARGVECTLTWETTLYTDVAGISTVHDAEFLFGGAGEITGWTAQLSPDDTGDEAGRGFGLAVCEWIETAEPAAYPTLCVPGVGTPRYAVWDTEEGHAQVLPLAQEFVAQSDVYPLSR
jgi:hypothetical protein